MPRASEHSSVGRVRLRSIVVIGLLALFALGCQGRGDMSGKVTYLGKAVPFGTVLVQSSDGSAHQANIERDGSYSVPGVLVGAVRVAVNSPNPKGITLVPHKDPKKKSIPYPDVPGWFAIPSKYETVVTSGLTYTIKGGANSIDIELQ
jgi:hypothetical protein